MRSTGLTIVLAAGLVATVGSSQSLQSPQAPLAASRTPGVAFLAIDLKSGQPLATEGAEHLDRPVAPGSVMKVVALAAALESEAVSPRTNILCTRETTVAGHHLTCTHPDLHRPLKPGEALAQSCNVFYARIAERIPRSAFDRVLSSLGLPPSDPGRPLAAAVLGLEGISVSPRRLLGMMTRITAEPTTLAWKAGTLAEVRAALRDAARAGSAEGLGARHIEALAKTGTVIAGGAAQGLVVGVTPVQSPRIGFVLLVTGAAGIDAAALAAERLVRLGAAAATEPRAIRVGRARDARGYEVREIPLEEYVGQVVAGESAPGSGPAALEALAVAARTYALANSDRHAAEGFDLCDLTHCQVVRPPTAASRRAAAATAGSVLLDHGKPAALFYTASCGGHSERPSAVWRGAPDPPFLPTQRDEACEGAPEWQSDIEAGALSRALHASGFRGDLLRGIAVTSRTSSGRVAWLRLDGLTPPEISGESFRTIVGRALGWQHVRSTAFTIMRTGRGFHLAGHGAGHGVGMCVLGSARLAANGQSANAILARYYPGLTLGSVERLGDPGAVSRRSSPTLLASEGGDRAAQPPSPVIRLVLPAGDESEREPITSLVTRELKNLTARLGAVPPPTVELRFHPTVESYQRSTAQPWFTAAATAAARIDLQPLASLRQRGILEKTIAHELVHLLSAHHLRGRKAWIVEGTAAYFAGELDADAAGDCPEDPELRRPASAASLRDARSRAAACVAARLSSGLSWRDIER